MKRLLTIKGLIVLALVTTIVAGAAIYASHVNVDTNITGAVTVTTTGDAIQILSGDGVTPINSGGTVQFGTVAVDPFGRSPVPVVGPIFVINVSNGPVQVWVTGDGGENIVPLFGPTQADLKPYPSNAFTLKTPGITGDTQSGYLGLSFQTISAGPKTTTIIFRATEVSPAALRDVNGDGKDDFIVGADLADPGNKLNAGSAYVHSGADGTLLYQVDGASTADRFGNSVSMAGDVNGDGAGDFIVGAWFADPGNKTNAGSAYVYSGADGSLLYQKNGRL